MRALPLLLAALVVAGCATPEETPALAEQAEAPLVTEDYALGNVTLPEEEVNNATLGAEHVHDLWNGAEQLVLLEAEIEAGLCEGPFDAAAYAFVQLFAEQEAVFGCARIHLPEGTVVPEGTGILRVEADATQALKSGSFRLDWRNKAREAAETPASSPKGAWSIPIEPADWDIPHAKATTFVLYLVSAGPVGAFEGPVQVRVVAERQEGWEPVLAIAHVDHWKLPSLHDFPAPGIMRLLDAELSVTNLDPARLTGGAPPEPVPLADLVAPGTRTLTLVVDRTGTSCVPVLDCWLVPLLRVGGYERERYGTLLHAEGDRRIYAWNVPDEVPEDSVYATASTTAIEARIDACATGTGDTTCGWASLASGSATARVQAYAWQGDVDLDMLSAVAG